MFDRNVPNVSPVHDAGGEIDQVVRSESEEIRRHELADSPITVFPFDAFGCLDEGPGMDWLSQLLVDGYRRSQFPLTHVFRRRTRHCGKRLHYPIGAGLTAASALFYNAQ